MSRQPRPGLNGENKLSYLLIAVVLAVALSPLLSMMPSRRQREIADLRQAAAMCGLFVELRDFPGAPRQDPAWAFYGRNREREDSGSPETIECIFADGQWSTRRGHPGAPRIALLEKLPVGIPLLISDLNGVGVFWDEQGQPDTVREIDTVLKSWLSTPSGG